jgi:predicted O-methyltransferase YrrM
MLSFADEQPARLAEAKARYARISGKMGGAADLDLLYTLCVAGGARNVLETGVAFGWSSLAILSAVAPRGGHLTSIDLPYPRQNNGSLVGGAVPTELREGWTLLRGADREKLPRAVREHGPFDLIHYDSDKSYRGRRWAYPILWGAVRPGGVLMSDDIGDNMGFLDFCREIGREPVVVKSGNKFVGCLRKPAIRLDRPFGADT